MDLLLTLFANRDMKRILLQGLLLLFVFFGLWFTFSSVDWMGIFRVEKISRKTEKKLGDLVWDFYKKSKSEITDKNLVTPIDSLVQAICKANNIETSRLKLHLIKSEEVNAFALPDQHLVINSGLIESCKNESELSGVIAHEIAHMQSHHVMKKLVKEMGLTAILSISTGGVASDMVKEIVQLISSSAYDRKLEKEADTKAVDYMVKTGINPFPFADFMERMAEKDEDNPSYFKWISTHPESLERAKYIRELAQKKSKEYKPVLTKGTWEQMQEDLKNQ